MRCKSKHKHKYKYVHFTSLHFLLRGYQPSLDDPHGDATQQHMALQAAFSQIPGVLKSVRDMKRQSEIFDLNKYLII